MRLIVRATCISWIFYIRDLRSGQFRDMPIRLVPWPKNRIQDPQDPTAKQNIKIQDL